MFNKCGSSILEGKGNKGISNKNPFHVYMAQVALLFDNTRQRYKLFESVKFFSEIMNACTSNYYLQPRIVLGKMLMKDYVFINCVLSIEGEVQNLTTLCSDFCFCSRPLPPASQILRH